MSGTFNVELRIHRKLRPHPDGRASPVPAGRSNRARQLGVALGGSRKTTLPTLIEPTSPRGGKTKWRATVRHVRARPHTVSCAGRSVHFPTAAYIEGGAGYVIRQRMRSHLILNNSVQRKRKGLLRNCEEHMTLK